MNPPPQQLVVRVEQLEAPRVSDPPLGGGTAMYRLVESRMSVCARHARELAEYLPDAEARVVLTTDQIDSLVTEFGLRRADLMVLHGPWDPVFGEEKCRMCETPVAEGNVCYDDDCKRPLHPQWPAVYCTSACANNDR